jgi:alkylation response protein AidB-like acyl-CoA dehydrogenase
MTDTAELAREREERLRMIRDSAASLVPPDGDLGRVRRLRFSAPGVDRAAWAEVCAMGWPGLRLDEAQGGSGLGMAEYAALLEELGRGLLPEPLIEASLVAPLLPDTEREALLAGEKLVLPAGIAYDEDATLPQLRDGKLHGEVGHVALGAAADAWLVACDAGLALVERGAEGLRLSQEPTQDGGHLARLRFDATPARVLVAPPAALDEAALACAAYLVGLMDAAFERTRDYLGVRSQFGRAIGSFQAIKHMAADLLLDVESATSAARHAAQQLADGSADAAAAIRLAAFTCADAYVKVAATAIQMHGGIAFTWDHPAHLYLRRARADAQLLGTPSMHREAFLAAMGA